MARRKAADADHRSAYLAGKMGRSMPPGIAARADRDPSLDRMHDAGRSGVPYDEALATHAPRVASPAPEPTEPAPAPPPRAPRSGGGGPKPKTFRQLVKGSPAETGAGAILGMVCYALVLSVVRYGAKGPVLWVRAKFLNETPTSTKTTSSTSSTSGKTIA